MRITRETLQEIRASGRAAARAWANGGAREALDTIGAAAGVAALESPGTGVISPQAATHLGHVIAEALRDDPDSSGTTLALAAALLASPHPSLRMVGPHLLAPLARESPADAGRIIQLADVCADASTAAALAIPLAAAVARDPSTTIKLGQGADTLPQQLALQATRRALAAKVSELTRQLPDTADETARQASPTD